MNDLWLTPTFLNENSTITPGHNISIAINPSADKQTKIDKITFINTPFNKSNNDQMNVDANVLKEWGKTKKKTR